MNQKYNYSCLYLCTLNEFFFKFIYLKSRTKIYDLDSKPICKHCFDKLPSKIRNNILKSKEDLKITTNANDESKINSMFSSLLIPWKKEKKPFK